MKHCDSFPWARRLGAPVKELLLGWILAGAAAWACLPLSAQLVADNAAFFRLEAR